MPSFPTHLYLLKPKCNVLEIFKVKKKKEIFSFQWTGVVSYESDLDFEESDLLGSWKFVERGHYVI